MDDVVTSDVSAAVAETGTDLVVTKEHSDPMTNAEFLNWVSTNLGALGLIDALQIAAFMACCDVIAQDVAKATLRLKRRITKDTAEIVAPEKHPIAEMLAVEPNRRHTWYEFKEMMAYWQCFQMNSFAGVIRNRFDEPLELLPFQSTRVMQKVSGRSIFYDVTAGTMYEEALLGATFATFPERDMIHVRGRLIDGMDGYATTMAGRTVLETASSLTTMRTNLFDEDGQMRGVFSRETIDKPLGEVEFQRLRTQFRLLMKRFRDGIEPVVLEGGLKFEPISSNPQEMELSKQFVSQVEEICRLLRVPPYKIFQMDGSKYENLETQEKQYLGDTLVPFCERFEEAYARTLLSRKERLSLFFEHDRDEMTVRDPTREMERVVKTWERGLITMNEGRAKMGWNPEPGVLGECRLVPTNMSLIDKTGKVILAGSSTASDKEGDKAPPKKDARDTLMLN